MASRTQDVARQVESAMVRISSGAPSGGNSGYVEWDRSPANRSIASLQASR